MGRSEPRFTIDELGARAAAALAEGYRPPENGQINPVPARRSIRYYTTLGLLDRPAEMRGRTALYGPRHLRQLVAIKRLQAEGHSLTAIQARLSGLPDRELEAIAQLPPELVGEGNASPSPAEPSASRRRAAFWRERPAPAERSKARELAPAVAPAREPRALVGVPLEPGIWLQLEAPRAITSEDAAAIRRAAEPIVRALIARGLAPAPEQEERE